MKKVKLFFAVGVASAVLSMTSFAGEWKQDANGWWYQNDDGSYSTNTWQEIGGKQYYFDANGYMLHDTTTPDGKQNLIIMEISAWCYIIISLTNNLSLRAHTLPIMALLYTRTASSAIPHGFLTTTKTIA